MMTEVTGYKLEGAKGGSVITIFMAFKFYSADNWDDCEDARMYGHHT